MRFPWFHFRKKEQTLPGHFVGRARVCDDTALKYRMGAGWPGSITRIERAATEANMPDATNPPNAYGIPVLLNAGGTGVRMLIGTDTGALAAYGIVVRDFPTQLLPTAAFGAPQSIGVAVPQTNQALTIMKSGYIVVKVNGTSAKGGTVYYWSAAPSGQHVTGGFEASNPGGSGGSLSNVNTYYNGAPDANGFVELVFNI